MVDAEPETRGARVYLLKLPILLCYDEKPWSTHVVQTSTDVENQCRDGRARSLEISMKPDFDTEII